MRGRWPPDRLDAGITSIEAALVLPIVMMLVMLLIQGGMWYNAREFAAAAAHQGATVAAAKNGTSSAAAAAARDYLRGSALQDAAVTVSMGTAVVTVAVTGQVPTLVPGLNWSTNQSAQAGREVFTR